MWKFFIFPFYWLKASPEEKSKYVKYLVVVLVLATLMLLGIGLAGGF